MDRNRDAIPDFQTLRISYSKTGHGVKKIGTTILKSYIVYFVPNDHYGITSYFLTPKQGTRFRRRDILTFFLFLNYYLHATNMKFTIALNMAM